MRTIISTFLLLVSFNLFGQQVECSTPFGNLIINESYLHFDHLPVIRVTCIVEDCKHLDRIISYRWQTSKYEFRFEHVYSNEMYFTKEDRYTHNIISSFPVSYWKIIVMK